MQTSLSDDIRKESWAAEADAVLRSCVHCGFCLATCPTYQVLGTELDSPRGRIYLIKQMLEGNPATARTRLHLDRCLTCRSCETTCPSGVRYGRLLEHGRALVERDIGRGPVDRLRRAALRAVVPHAGRFGALLGMGRAVRPLLPGALKRHVPESHPPGPWPEPRHARRMLVLDGCAQSSAAPRINAAAARVLDQLGISLVRVPQAGCCGAVHEHTGDPDGARAFARRNVEAWWPLIQQGAEAVVVTASGCGVTVKDYAHLLQGDPAWAERAARIAALARDLSEVVVREDRSRLAGAGGGRRIAVHTPCTLQHGQKLGGVVDRILREAGFRLTPVADGHLCCGSAGTYSLLQPEIAGALRSRKLEALTGGDPEEIATANIGCLLHLQSESAIPVRHWIELLDVNARAAAGG